MEKDIKFIDKAGADVIYRSDKIAGIQIADDYDLIKIEYNMFDKKDVIFRDIKISITLQELNETIGHLQKIISNSNDLQFLADMIMLHYFNPFESDHRRSNIIFHGGQNTGKTTITNIICDLFNATGKLTNWQYNKKDNFNKELKGATIIVQNEYKKTDDSANFIKQYSGGDTIEINAKNEPKFIHPFYAMFMCCVNPSAKNPITNLIEEKDNRNYLIEMDNNKELLSAQYLKNNYQLVHTALICLGVKNRNILNIMELPHTLGDRTRIKTQALNLEKYNFYEFINYVIEEFEVSKKQRTYEDKQHSIAIHKRVFNKYFTNQKDYLTKTNDKVLPILELEMINNISTTSATKQVIKEIKEPPFYEISDIRSSVRNVYILLQESINILRDISILDDDNNSRRSFLFTGKDYFNLINNELKLYLLERKKYFKNDI